MGHPDDPLLTQEQFDVCLEIWQWQRGGCVGDLKVHIQGAGGSGKTFLLKVLQRFLPEDFVEQAASTGVAAAQMGNGSRTMHSSVKFRAPRGGKGSRDLYSGPMSSRTEAALALNFPNNICLLVVDEMSM